MTNRNIEKNETTERLNNENCKLMVFSSIETPLNHQTCLNTNLVHFFYCKTGEVIFQFSEHYKRNLEQGSYFTIYDQQRALDVVVHSDKCELVYMALAPKFVHDALLDDKKTMVKLGFEGFGVREYSVKNIGFSVDIVLENLLSPAEPNALKSTYYKAKVLELLSFTFDVAEESLYEACPFLKEKDNVERIKKARNILIENMEAPPSLPNLAKEIGMNEYNLKVGFKNVYGQPPFKYLQEHKLNLSKKLLSNGQHQVSEIADIIGYKSASHFIEAFRKKFGNTPKQFMMSNS